MTTLSRRRPSLADTLSWIENESGIHPSHTGLAPYVRLEDFVDGGHYVLRAEMPGINPDEDVQVEVRDDTLTIRGERKEETHDRHRQEFHYGTFERTVRLPHGTRPDEIEASYHDGILELRVPLDGDQTKAVRIPVARSKS